MAVAQGAVEEVVAQVLEEEEVPLYALAEEEEWVVMEEAEEEEGGRNLHEDVYMVRALGW